MTRTLVSLGLLAILVHFATGAASRDFTYELAPGDEVRVTVFREPDMSGVFRVDDSGVLSVPGAGDVVAAGSSLAELRKALVRSLEKRHLANPDVVLQIVQYAPIYIMGDVRTPGKYSYTPGMTALQLVAIAGGFAASQVSTDSTFLLREQSRYREELMIARERFAALSIRRNRLLAERSAVRDFEVPKGLDIQIGRDRIEQIVAAEMNLLKIRLDEPVVRSNLLLKQRAEINNEMDALSTQLESVRQLKTIVDAELKAIRQLRQQGITANARVMELERLAVDTDLKIHATLAAISQTLQDGTSVDLQLQKINEDVQTRTAESLAETETEIAVLGRKIVAALEFLSLTGSDLQTDNITAQAKIDRLFVVSRPGSVETEVVNGGATVRPGDILTVVRQLHTAPNISSSQSSGPAVTER